MLRSWPVILLLQLDSDSAGTKGLQDFQQADIPEFRAQGLHMAGAHITGNIMVNRKLM
jgi:hypothetical protein